MFYEDKTEGLGEKFLKALREKYDQILLNPKQFNLVYADKETTFRDVKLKGFPYLIYYNVVGREVIIYMVHNTHKKDRDLP